ncbi:MAG: hypothetical protein LBV17_07760 [Treponema sp.]|nr:hypothetical protein [Treponema sp.]
MRGKEGDKNAEEEKKVYCYIRCSNPDCGIKLHYETYKCWKCGAKPEAGIYRSTNPEDAKFCLTLNNIEKCFKCYKVQYGSQICEPIFCFGTGRGKCELCKQLPSMRFECCQEYQKEGVPTKEDIKSIYRRNDFIKPLQIADNIRDEIPF